jgi:hypothetical protein
LKPVPLLRTAFGLTLFFCVAHTFGTVNTAVRDPREQAVMDAMKGYQFDAMGVMRTPFDFYYGLGLFLSLNLAILAVLLWMVGTMARDEPARARPFVGVLALGHVTMAALCWWKFFPAPLVTTSLTAACLVWAWHAMRQPAE